MPLAEVHAGVPTQERKWWGDFVISYRKGEGADLRTVSVIDVDLARAGVGKVPDHFKKYKTVQVDGHQDVIYVSHTRSRLLTYEARRGRTMVRMSVSDNDEAMLVTAARALRACVSPAVAGQPSAANTIP